MTVDQLYHIGFGRSDLGENPPIAALLSGDPERARAIAQATDGIRCIKTLSENRGLNSYLCELTDGTRFCSMTTGMGGPSLSIVVNEAFQVGIRRMIRVGTCGSIQDHIRAGSVAIASGAVCYQGAADDIAPPEFPAVCDPFLTVKLAQCAAELGVDALRLHLCEHGHLLRRTRTCFRCQPDPAQATAWLDRGVALAQCRLFRNGDGHPR